jgi:hypothetical protein
VEAASSLFRDCDGPGDIGIGAGPNHGAGAVVPNAIVEGLAGVWFSFLDKSGLLSFILRRRSGSGVNDVAAVAGGCAGHADG